MAIDVVQPAIIRPRASAPERLGLRLDDAPVEHAVHDDRVVGLARRHEEPVAAVDRDIDRMPRLRQALLHEPRDAVVILDEEELH